MTLKEFMEVFFERSDTDDTSIIVYDTLNEQTHIYNATAFKTQMHEPMQKKEAERAIMQWCVDFDTKSLRVFIC